jgi:hypothetical protein
MADRFMPDQSPDCLSVLNFCQFLIKDGFAPDFTEGAALQSGEPFSDKL